MPRIDLYAVAGRNGTLISVWIITAQKIGMSAQQRLIDVTYFDQER